MVSKIHLDAVSGVANVIADSGKEIGDYCISARNAKARWLKCDGSAVSRTAYADLFSVIGTSFGVGDGATTFNLPDPLGRLAMISGSGSGLTARAAGAKGGAETHQITANEMPAHHHQLLGNGAANGVATGLSDGGSKSVGGNSVVTGGTGYTDAPVGIPGTPYVQNTGGGAAHNNMPPYIALGNLFIYPGV